ncbi:hypothetical protein K2173_015054 [Erythroxylum novogranatense]|uniref:Uncharacterized protein n=1 Tax=Erythroxylum novogranatense TaxID=1862640 RepID=A0AAV8T0U4_9ROSI|nr:hypothetical protein K2173_015054 [Erythroxylum novogranatense]
MASIVLSIALMVAGYLIDQLIAPIGPMIVEYLLGPIKTVIAYVYYYMDNIQGLKEEVEKLVLVRERVQHMIDDARRNGEEVEADVRKWLKAVHDIVEEASHSFDVEEHEETSFFDGLYPNFMLRYQISKKAIDMAKVVEQLQEKGRFDRVSYSVTSRWKGITAVEGYKSYESRMPTSRKIMSAFRDKGISIIGLYGMGGVGKTTLVKEVGRQALEDKLFDEVVMATVTQSPDPKKIQGEIADKLGMRFDEESIAGRAGHLRERLKKENKVLVILDDVWGSIDLEGIGVSCGNCKILLASRSVDVLSTEMNTQKNFGVEVLPYEEAWDLFKEMAGDCVDDPELHYTATEITKECAGLPVAIVTVARALRNKTSFEWKNALRQLRRPNSSSIRGMQAVIYATLELSYSQLESQELKSTFLLCSLMTHNASIHNLLKYGMGLGLFHGVYTTEEARDRVNSLVRSLKASCLLEDGDTSDSFSMHKVVRDVALSIASREQHVFVLKDEAELVEWPDEDMLKKCTSISLQSDVEELPDQLNCPELKFFYIGGKDPFLKLPDRIFERLDALKVLHMTCIQSPSLPISFSSLENLRTLYLDQCTLGDTAIIGELRKLIILSFAGSDIKSLPRELRNLTRLKVLDLSNCVNLIVIPPNVISSLSQLEELHMANSYVGWELSASKFQKGNASIDELKNLSQLVSLDLQIQDPRSLPKDILFESLTRYRILVGDCWDWSGEYEGSRAVKLSTCRNLENGIMVVLKRSEYLLLDRLNDVMNVLDELDSEGFPRLKHLHIQNSNGIRYVVHPVEGHLRSAFPALESLFLKNLINLEKICQGKLTAESFHKLQTVNVEKCERLKNLFPLSMFRGLLQLQEMKITDCQVMEEIVTCGDDNQVTAEFNFSQLRSLELKYLPKLMNFCSNTRRVSAASQETTLATSTPFLNDKALKTCSIVSQQLPRPSVYPLEITCFQNLTFLRIKGCHNLTYLLSSSASTRLVKLKRFEVHKCNLIKEVLTVLGEERTDTLLFPELEFLSLKDLPNLTRFCWGNNVSFPSLNKLYIKHCPKLKEFVFCPCTSKESLHISRLSLFSEKVQFPDLKVMKISHLHSIKMLWHNQLSQDSFCNLKTLKVKHCQKLQSIFPSTTLRRLQNLESLIVIDCHSVVEIFDVQGDNVKETPAGRAGLRNIQLSRLPKLKNLWSKDPEGILTYKNIQSVSIFNCANLKSVFPASLAKGLEQLKQLEVDSSSVVEIFANGKRLDVAEILVFPKVACLRLQALPGLGKISSGLHIEWPLLKKLEINGCHEAETFASDCQSFQKRQGAGQPRLPVSRPLFLVETDAFPTLEELTLERNVTLKEIWHGEFLAQFYAKNPSQIRELKLSKLFSLTYIWKEDSFRSLIFQNLENLDVSYCGRLKSLVPSSVSFEHLTILEVSYCDRLTHLITPTTAKSMGQLVRMKISECQTLREIVTAKKGEAEDEIVFRQLAYLELNCLPRLSCFCSGNQTFSFPSLENASVKDCPEMNRFSSGALSMPKLRNSLTLKKNMDEAARMAFMPRYTRWSLR